MKANSPLLSIKGLTINTEVSQLLSGLSFIYFYFQMKL